MKYMWVRILLTTGFWVLLSMAIPVNYAQAQSSGSTFQQAVVEYQKSRTPDMAGKVIKLAVAMDKLPAIPEEARKHFVKGTALFKEAHSQEDFKQVIDEFKQATQIAPWWPEARYNQALACETAREYNGAIESFNLYKLFKLSDDEARVVQDKIYVLEARQDKAVKGSSQEAVSAKKELATKESANETSRKKDEAKEDELDVSGHWKKLGGNNCDEYFFHYEFRQDGNQIVQDMVCDRTTQEADGCGMPVNRGYRSEMLRLPRTGGSVFQGIDHIGNNLRLEFQGDMAVKTWLSDGSKKNYFKR